MSELIEAVKLAATIAVKLMELLLEYLENGIK